MTIDGQYFGLKCRPFQLTPDPNFWFESATHRKAMAYLGYGLVLGEGFIVITGDIGSGKTTLLGHLLGTIDPSRVEAARLSSATLGAGDALAAMAHVFGLSLTDHPRDLLSAIEDQIALRARMGKRILIAVDEAQSLSMETLEQLRMVSNVNMGNQPVVQFLLLGQPEFRDMLAHPKMQQLSERVIATHHLTGMEPDEVEAYLRHRLARAGWDGQPRLAPDLASRVGAIAQYNPRRINQLMTRALVLAAMQGGNELSGDMVELVYQEQMDEAQGIVRTIGGAAPADRIGSPPSPSTSIAPELLEMRNRMSQMERQLADQDAALRRVLNQLVDWVEGENSVRSPLNSGR